MEKHCNEEDKLIQEIIEKSGLETPSTQFSAGIMKKIRPKAPAVSTTTLISVKGWVFMAILFVASSALLYFYPIADFSITENLTTSVTQIKDFTPSLNVSKYAIYAFLFMGLFLIQIPFLKNYVSKQYTSR